MKNGNERFRIQPSHAKLLGLELNPNNRYRLDKETKEQYFKLRRKSESVKRLFFDIETSQYETRSFRIGYNLNLSYDNVTKLAKIICISWNWENEDVIHNLRWDKNRCDKKMVSDFIEILSQADEVVAHNGDRFDMKWLRTRAIYHKIPMRANYKTFDTLKKSKAYFNFPNNRLDTIAQFLSVGAKVKHDGLKMWNEVQDGNEFYLNEMVKYCDGDIVVLKDVYLALEKYVKTNTHAGVLNNNLKYSCPCCSSEQITLVKNNVTAMGTIKRLIECNDCNYNYEISNSSYILYLKFKNVI